MKKIILFVTLIVFLSIPVIVFITHKKTYGFKPETEEKQTINLRLNYDNNKDTLTNNIFEFINLIDNSLFSSMNNNKYDFNLNENYEFMTDFAINFILNNKNYYSSNIKQLDTFKYEIDGNIYETNEYVDEDIIYDITNSIFNVKNYYITNDYLKVINNEDSLIDFNNKVDMEIEKINEINIIDNSIFVEVSYNNINYFYIYEFNIENNQLFLVNIDVGV